MPDLVVFDGPTFWARSGETVQTNSGDPLRGHGGTDIVKLLLSSRVPDGYDLTALDEQDEVAGRTCAVVNAVPHPPDPYGHTPGSEVFDMIAGGALFRLSVDVDTGVLLRVIKVVDGVDAEICELLDVVLTSHSTASSSRRCRNDSDGGRTCSPSRIRPSSDDRPPCSPS